MKRTEIVYNEIKLQQTIGVMRKEFSDQGYLRVQMSTDKPRTLSQNALIYALYGQISREGGQESPSEVRRRCKLTIGVPILRSEDADYCSGYDAVIKPLTYEQKLIAMDFWPVTSQMSTDQLSRYYEEMERREVTEAREVA